MARSGETRRLSGTINRSILRHARAIAEEVSATAILVCVEPGLAPEELEALVDTNAILAVDSDGTADRIRDLGFAEERIVQLPSMNATRTSQVKVAVMLALSRELIRGNDLLVCVSGSPRRGVNDSLTVMDVSQELEIFASSDVSLVSHRENPHVFDRLLTLVLELAQEGKEGRPVGTTFVLGDHEKVLEMSTQMVINAFAAVSESERNILDPALKEVIREFTTIDGAFIIREDGVVLAAGRHLNASAETTQLPQGLGARHRAAAGITALTNAVAMVISESTGDVRIFSQGRMFMDIERGQLR